MVTLPLPYKLFSKERKTLEMLITSINPTIKIVFFTPRESEFFGKSGFKIFKAGNKAASEHT